MTSKRLYIAGGLNAPFTPQIHVDPVRWVELYGAFSELGYAFDPVSLFEYFESGNVEKLTEQLHAADVIFIHHETALCKLEHLLGAKLLTTILEQKTSYLQADCLQWDWLQLDIDSYLPRFTMVCVGNVEDATNAEKPLVPLGSIARPSIFDRTSNRILYVGRYKPWFNERFERLVHSAACADYHFDIFTYPEMQKDISAALRNSGRVGIHDPVLYAELGESLGPARMGLAFRNNNAPNGKIWDYLSMGLPVLFERRISEESTILKYNAGIPFGHNSDTSLRAAIRGVEAFDHPLFLHENSWLARARTWVTLMA